MFTVQRSVAVIVVAGILWALPPSAQGQVPGANPGQAQYMANLMATAQSFQQVPPWIGAGGTAGANPYTPGLGGPVNPYTPGGLGSGLVNPYAPGGYGGYGGLGANPWSGNPWGNPWEGSWSGYVYDTRYRDLGEFLKGASQVMRAYPGIIKGNEQARILREVAEQAKIDTAKKRFDYMLYVKANTPTYTDIQIKVFAKTLERIRNSNNPTEINSGVALKVLLDDLRKYPGKKISDESISLSEDVLKHLNVTGSDYNLGLLRNDGRFTWPTALNDLLKDDERDDIKTKAEQLIAKAIGGTVPDNVLRDLQRAIRKARERVLKKANELEMAEYMQAKRFLNDFDAACSAVEKGDAVAYFKFREFVGGGKTIQEVVDYMVKNGLRFAPAITGQDEAAYQALHSALAAYNAAINSQVASVATTKEKE